MKTVLILTCLLLSACTLNRHDMEECKEMCKPRGVSRVSHNECECELSQESKCEEKK